jgi:NAD(P)H-hydrate epimerase
VKAVLTPAEMSRVDAKATRDIGLEVLVARAGAAVAQGAIDLLGGAYGRRVVVVAGRGHNGDDGRVAARLLARRGVHVTVREVGDGSRPLPPCDLVIDAAFGTGFHGSYDAPAVPDRPGGGGRAAVLAVDVPTGLDATSGVASPGAVRADRTVSFGALKPGMLFGDGPSHCGEIELASIGLSIEQAAAYLVGDEDAKLLPTRRPSGHKWDAAVYVVAGSPGMHGAAALATRGAQRAGAGMVRLASPGVTPGTIPVIEAVARPLPASGWAMPLLDDLGRCRALVLGPGLGQTPETTAAVRRLVTEAAVPMVLDADGLNVLGSADDAARLVSARRAPIVLTPHDGEYARLMGALPGADRIAAARELARQSRAHVLLKGSTTVVAAPGGDVLLATSGSPRLATAGTGDVLSGIIGAFLAVGLSPLLAAALAAHVHGRAAARGFAHGLVAGDLPDLVAQVLGAIGPEAGTTPSGPEVFERRGSGQ